MINESLFYAKILLFGEYGIIEDSMGLSIPFNHFQGKFVFPKDSPSESQLRSNKSILKFVSHLKTMQFSGELPCKFNLKKLESDLENGLYFDSSIPQGFGVGSSGALVAALYATYVENPITSEDIMIDDNLNDLKNRFVLNGKLLSW